MRLGVSKPKPYTNPYYYTKIDTFPYGTSQIPYNPRHVSILKFHTCDLLFPFLLSFFFLFFFFLSLLFSLIRVCSPFLQDQNEIFILVLSLLFHFLRRKLPPSFLQATCLFHNLSSLFHSNIFLFINMWSLISFYSLFNLSKSYFDT